jgi:RNA 2',3'-cyclic 3'-phosphodiesterase
MKMKQKHRIFIAINLPGDLKELFGQYQQKWSDLPARWVAQDNLHMTLAFLGSITDIDLGAICMATKEVALRHEAIDISLDNIGYVPPDKVPPRMLWASGQKSMVLSKLKRDLENALSEKIKYFPEERAFAPHITLARISAFAWRQINPEERPEAKDNIDIKFTAESIEVMESEIKRGVPRYFVIESYQLGAS